MITAGKIIEYLDNGKFICGLITGMQPKRVHLFNQNKRELNLPISRIIHCSKEYHPLDVDKDNIARKLQHINTNRSNLMDEIDLEEIWELISEEEMDSYEPSFLAELAFGEEANDDIVCAILRAVFLNRTYFKYKEGRIKAHSQKQVEMLLKQAEREREKKELILKGASILQSIDSSGSYSQVSHEDLRDCLSIVQDYYLYGSESKYREIAKEMLSEAGYPRLHDPYHILIKAGIWDHNENIPLLRSNIPVNFSLQAIQQAETILQSSTDSLFKDPYRKDLTSLSPITIDGATTLDFDDALTIETVDDGYLVGIHISDVAHYVQPSDPLFLEAVSRGTSIYFPERQIPMLPRHLSQGICSLIQDEIRAAMSFMIKLTPDAEVIQVRIHPSIIKVSRRLTYEEADTLMESDKELAPLNMLCKKLRKQRLEAGALLLPFPDVNIHIDSFGKVHVSLGPTDTPSRILISEMMILANKEAAKYISDRMLPGLFRAQEPPKQHIVKGEDNDLYLNTRQRKQLSRGEILTSAKRHAGLGVNQYTTVTSPIRRLLDLVMQHQIHSLVRRQEPKFSEERCREYSAVISRTLADANAVKQQRHRYWLLVYLQDRVGSHMDALVIESGPKRIMLILVDILFDFDLPTPLNSKPQPGSLVKVRVIKSNPLDNIVRFDWN